MASVTRFGSSLDTPVTASAVLRALASRLGSSLLPASEVDLVAATIAADGWMLTLGAGALADATVLDAAASAALVNVLLRASGMGAPSIDQRTQLLSMGRVPSSEPAHAAAADAYRAWAERMLEYHAPEALLRAAADLDVDGPLGSMAVLLALVADACPVPAPPHTSLG